MEVLRESPSQAICHKRRLPPRTRRREPAMAPDSKTPRLSPRRFELGDLLPGLAARAAERSCLRAVGPRGPSSRTVLSPCCGASRPEQQNYLVAGVEGVVAVVVVVVVAVVAVPVAGVVAVPVVAVVVVVVEVVSSTTFGASAAGPSFFSSPLQATNVAERATTATRDMNFFILDLLLILTFGFGRSDR